ncbi:MAG TPA: hypothetical protein VG097_03440 [Gemmata sp.]|jgi:hypothetical protein|nr:hypothetical protein [Gemmata sp.]
MPVGLIFKEILDAAITSRHENGKRIETPYLEIKVCSYGVGLAKGEILKVGKR